MTETKQQLNQNLTGTLIDNGALELVSIIGIGAYGVVYKALAADGKYYAVKCLNKTGLDSRQRSFQRREIALHTLASSHPNIVTLHNVIETSTCIYVVLSYCPDGDLFAQITEKSRYLGDDALIRDVFLQIVDAVDYCHRLGIYHRDLKPENILCDAGGARVVLADFGLATAEKTSGDFGCGSTFYMSPECQGGLFQRLGSYSTLHNDVWSLGVILVNLTCGRNPWKQACPSDETFRAYLSNPDFLRSILPVSKQCNELLKRIFALNPAHRISIKDLKAEVRRMGRWTMTLDELRYATRATKEAARAWAPAHILDDPNYPDAPPPKAAQHARNPAGPAQPSVQHQHGVRPSRHHHHHGERPAAAPSVEPLAPAPPTRPPHHHQQHHEHQASEDRARRALPQKALQPSFFAPSAYSSPRIPSLHEAPPSSPRISAADKVSVEAPCHLQTSDSDVTSSDEDMDYSPSRAKPYSASTRPQQVQHHFRALPQHPFTRPHEASPVRAAKAAAAPPPPQSPAPLTVQSPRTPRQLLAAATQRQRKQSIESTSSSSSSSASSDASWTGLPPTPDTPVFTKRTSIVAIQPEKPRSPMLSLGAAKFKLAF